MLQNQRNPDYLSLAEREKQQPGYWQPTLTAGMLTQLKNMSGGVWSPDSRYLYLVLDFDGRSDVYRLDTTTNALVVLSGDYEATPLAMLGQGAAVSPELNLSPDGTKLVYTSGKDGKLYQISSQGGVARQLCLGEGAQINPAWSPDGKQVAFVAVFEDTTCLAVCASEDLGFARRLTSGEYFAFGPRWLPASTAIIYHETDNRNTFYDESRLVRLELVSGKTTVLKEGLGKSIYFALNDYRPSPDGNWLAYSSDESGWANLYLLNLETGESYPLHAQEAEQSNPVWSPDSKKLAYHTNSHGSISLQMATLEGQNFGLVEGEAVHSCVNWSPDGKTLCYVRQTPQEPPNLWLLDVASRQTYAVTFNLVGGLESAGMVSGETVSWTSPDGLKVEGLMLKPANIQKGQHPMLLYVHGGPYGQYHRRFDPAPQYWVNRGWVVIEPNFRGSTGYGRSFRRKLAMNWGQEDMLDNVGGIDFASSEGLIDPSRVVSWGASGGGYATFMLTTKWSERFKAGVALVAVSNTMTLAETTDRPARYLVDDLLGIRAANYKLHYERSPVNFAHLNETPLLILMGEVDKRVPPAQGEEMVEALKKAGKTDFEYHSYSGEAHGWRKRSTWLDQYHKMDKFLAKWVLGR